MTDYWDAIVNLPIHIAYLLWCPIYQAFGFIIYIVNSFYTPMAAIVNSFINLGNDVIQFFTTITYNFLPGPIAALLIIGVGLVVGLRIWSFISKISIFGIKVG